VSLPERLISHSKFPGTARPGSGGSIRPSISAALGLFHRRVLDRPKSHEEIVQFGGAGEEASLSSTSKKTRYCRCIPFGRSRPDALSKYTDLGEFRISLADSSEYSSFRITPYTLVIYQCALLEYVVCAATLCVSLSAGSFLWPQWALCQVSFACDCHDLSGNLRVTAILVIILCERSGSFGNVVLKSARASRSFFLPSK
jgi:hypothetical protein